MEFKTLEQRFLADYAMLEQENEGLKKEIEILTGQLERSMQLCEERGDRLCAAETHIQGLVDKLSMAKGKADVLEANHEGWDDESARLRDQLHQTEVERDHHSDCVKDMLAIAKWYGFIQPQRVEYNPETGGVKAVELA